MIDTRIYFFYDQKHLALKPRSVLLWTQGLKGEDILIEASILAVADVVEAMASYRPYRSSLGLQSALTEIEDNAGILYDSKAVDTCIKLFRENRFKLE